MYKIVSKRFLTSNIVEMSLEAKQLAKAALPGQFLIVKMHQKGERIPLTVCDVDVEKGLVVIVYQIVGKSTKEMSNYQVGDSYMDLVGPLGRCSDLAEMSDEDLQKERILFVAGGVGTAPVYPQVKYLHARHIQADVIIGAKNKEQLIYVDEMQKVAGHVYVSTDDGSFGHQGFVTDVIKDLVEVKQQHYTRVVAIGPMIMMKNVARLTQSYGIPTIVSLNSLMVDGTGMCGACRVSIGGQTKFTCVDGPEFNAFDVNFDEAMCRQAMYANVNQRTLLEQQEQQEEHICYIGGVSNEQPDRMKRVPIRERDAKERAKTFKEVCLGYTEEEAVAEAKRCLQCKNSQCVSGCPVAIAIPTFISQVAAGQFDKAANTIAENSSLPAVCGRVCPQETQCEGKCVLGKKGDAVAIGKLERFVADWARKNQLAIEVPTLSNGHKVAVVGSGPAGLTCAAGLAKMGYSVTIFEALHDTGGVLRYGIPEFRLPKKEVVDYEVENVRKLGVNIETDVVIGRTITIDALLHEHGFEAIFVGSGAGSPNFMNIKGENLNGVVSANEFLTRNNLMKSYDQQYDTPNFIGKKTIVVGGGNVAMDAARTALRLGSEVTIIYRRSLEELPARAEEVHHAKEEGIQFQLLCNPVEIIGNEQGWVKKMKVQRMQLGQPDASGRRKPVPIENDYFEVEADLVIVSIGTSPNPLIVSTTENLAQGKYGEIVADENGQTSREGIFAGGDAVSGSATVILAMGAGRVAAQSIDRYLKEKDKH